MADESVYGITEKKCPVCGKIIYTRAVARLQAQLRARRAYKVFMFLSLYAGL